MERNKWETALRCLEIAVHSNTSDEEVIAAVNGFRRTADGMPLGELCREFAGVPVAAPAAGPDKFDRLSRDNIELRQRIEILEAAQAAAAERADVAESRARETAEQLHAAEARAVIAEQQLAEFQAMYGRISGGLHDENLGLRRALDDARRRPAQPPTQAAAAPFRHMLSAARQRHDPAAPAVSSATVRPWTA